MNDKVFVCRYLNLITDRIFELKFFGVSSMSDPAYSDIPQENFVYLPSTTVTINTIDKGQYEISYGVPEPIYAELSVDITMLDKSNADHQTFIQMILTPNAWALRPCVVITEIGVSKTYSKDIFIGKLDKGITNLGLSQTQVTIQAEHLICYTLRNISANWLEFILSDMIEYNTKTAPFAYYYNAEDADGWRKSLVYAPYKVDPGSTDINRDRVYADDLDADPRATIYDDYYDLDKCSIEFVKLTDVLSNLSVIVHSGWLNLPGLASYCRKYIDYSSQLYFDFKLIFNENVTISDLPLYRQTYDGSGGMGDKLGYSEIYIIRKITDYQGTVIYNAGSYEALSSTDTTTQLNKDGRWNNLWDFLTTLSLANLSKVIFEADRIFFRMTIGSQNSQELPTISVNQASPIEVEDITLNLFKLDNLDVVNLEHTNDDIKNKQDSINGTNSTGDNTTIQLVFHNQMPNNTNIGGDTTQGWKGISEGWSVLTSVHPTNPDVKALDWKSWGWSLSYQGNEDVLYINKPGDDFVYLMWYFENIHDDHPGMLDREMPYLVHWGVQVDMNFPNDRGITGNRTAAEVVKEIQDKGCLHNQVIKKIREDWYSDKTKPHYELTLKMPLLRWEQLANKTIDIPSLDWFDKMLYNIDAQAAFGLNLASINGWIVIGSKCDLQSGMVELQLVS